MKLSHATGAELRTKWSKVGEEDNTRSFPTVTDALVYHIQEEGEAARTAIKELASPGTNWTEEDCTFWLRFAACQVFQVIGGSRFEGITGSLTVSLGLIEPCYRDCYA